MKLIILTSLIVAAVLAEDSNHPGDHKKRLPQKNSLNAIPSNGHQKPEYGNYQQQPPTSQHALYVQQNYQQQDGPSKQANHQQSYNIAPQIVPIQIVPQSLATPKYQLLGAKAPNGQMQLALIPHNVFMSLLYGSHALVPVSHPLLSNHVQQSIPSQSVVANDVSPNYSNYVAQPVAYAQPTNSLPVVAQTHYFSNQKSPYSYTHNSAVSPSPLLYSHPSSQIYNNYVSTQSSNAYPGPSNYNHHYSNPLGKYHFTYNPDIQLDQSSSYQVPSSSLEYEKSNALHSQTVSASVKTEHVVNPNEFIPQVDDTHFKPIPSYRNSYRS